MRRTAIPAVALLAVVVFLIPSRTWSKARESVLAGTWYPSDPIELGAVVDAMLNQASPLEVRGRIVALVSPHAGYRYSGPTAAAGYSLLRGRTYDSVVILAPSHRHPFNGVSVNDQGPYRTPLGEVPLDKAFIRELKDATPLVRYVPEAHSQEHAVEIQLPFLQAVLGNFRLVPLVMGFADQKECVELASALARCAKGRNVLLIASTDLSHYHPAREAEAMDGVLASCVEAFDTARLASELRSGGCEACGALALLTTMYAAADLGANRAVIVAQTHSGKAAGDMSRVVGYLSAALVDDGSGRQLSLQANGAKGLDDQDRRKLLDIARGSIHAALMGSNYELPADLSDSLKAKSGAFVTIKRQGQLRGCIGHVVGRAPLAETVVRCARAAAFEDPRFEPLRPEEFEDLDIEISVMTPLRLGSAEEVEVGKHGILIRRGWSQGLLLPQVATEWGWDREAFLSNTCRKAGMGPDCWRDPATEIYLFSAEVF